MSVTHKIRSKNGLKTIKIYRKVMACRKFCLECCGDSYAEVQRCTDSHCALFPFRLGNEKGLSEENTAHLKEGYKAPTEDEEEEAYFDSLEEEENEEEE